MPLDFRSFDSAEARSHHGLDVLVRQERGNARAGVHWETLPMTIKPRGADIFYSSRPRVRHPLASGRDLQLRPSFQRGDVEERGAVGARAGDYK